jgi:transposase
LLVDGRGVPLSLVVTGANRHDVSQLEAILDAIMVERPSPPIRRHKHLCADAGYTGAPALKVIEEHGYIPHVKGRGQEADELKRDPEKKARRWVVEVAHSWFNRFRTQAIGAVRETRPKLPCVKPLGRIHHGIPENQM